MNVLIITLTFSQKHRPLLETIARFLKENGIGCIVYKSSETVHEIRVRRIADVRRLLRMMKLILKREQAVAALAYFDGKITGNEVLQIFDSEHRLGKRRSTPLKPSSNFPLTYTEAVRMAQETRASAARLANQIHDRGSLLGKLDSLPSMFGTAELARVFECSRANALSIAHQMEANGLVSCIIIGTRGRGKLLCTKLKLD